MQRSLAVADDAVPGEIEEVDPRLLDVPDVAVEHVAARQLARTRGEQRLVAGTEIVTDGGFTGATPGTVLRRAD